MNKINFMLVVLRGKRRESGAPLKMTKASFKSLLH